MDDSATSGPAKDLPITPATDDAAPVSSARRVQVVARWNSWVQVMDPSDGSLQWVDLGETAFAPA